LRGAGPTADVIAELSGFFLTRSAAHTVPALKGITQIKMATWEGEFKVAAP